MPENVWIARVDLAGADRRNDAVAQEVVRLFGELRVPLLRYVHGLGLPWSEGEDVVQEAFVELFRGLRGGLARDNLRAWLYRVSRNGALKRLERRREVAFELDVESADGQASPEERVVATERERTVMATIAALPLVDRQCLQLRAEGLRYREIATVLGISLGSVAGSLSRALDRIARATEREK